MISPRRLAVLTAVAALALLTLDTAPAFAATPGEVPAGQAAGKAALDASRAAYRAAGPFREAVELVLELPDGRREDKKQEYGVGKDGGAFLTLSTNGKETIRIVAREGRIVGAQFNVEGRYAEAPYQGDFADALRRLGGGPAQLGAPAAVVAGQGGDLDAFLTALRFGILEPLEIAGFRPRDPKSGLDEVDLRAGNGELTVGLDPASHRMREVRIALGEGEQQVRAAGPLRFTAGDPGPALALPDLGGRTAVATLAALEVGDYPLGKPAPQVALRSPGGETVETGKLRGSVVVLDFWATWCVPCWTALGHTAELAAWAKASGLPVKVFAVNTLEKTKDPEEQGRKAADLLRAKHLDLPVLLDSGNTAFAAFHNPGLPSLVILDKEGRLARYHPGLIEDMTATVKAEVLELLK